MEEDNYDMALADTPVIVTHVFGDDWIGSRIPPDQGSTRIHTDNFRLPTPLPQSILHNHLRHHRHYNQQ